MRRAPGRFVGIVAASFGWSGLAAAGAGGDDLAVSAPHVALPFACSIDRGRVLLTPGPERLYRIVGARDSHAHTACVPGQPDRCRTWQIHRFDLLCGTARVAWIGVVGAALERTPGRARIENNRLHLRLGLAWRQPRSDGRDTIGPPPNLIFPAGYAPSLGLGMRFVGGQQQMPTVVDLPRARPETKAARAALEPVALTTVESVQPPSSAEQLTAVAGWQTAIAPAVERVGLTVERAMVVAGAVIGVWLALVLIRRRGGLGAILPQAAIAGPESPADGLKAAEARMSEAAECSELISRAVNLHRATRDALAVVAEGDVRDLLGEDLAKVQQSLLSKELTGQVAAGSWAPVRETVTRALTDLERIGRIVAGLVRRSTGQGRGPVEMPATADEAFELLGVNPQASKTVVKKIVDGLRQSWHPDHAHDETDRQLREDRMKQINIAWDLIQSKQRAA
jgi:hypothetical protein